MTATITVLMLGPARAAAGGKDRLTLSVAGAATPTQVRESLLAAVPSDEWRALVAASALAVDQEYVSWGDATVDCAAAREVALIAPVSGG
jgi:hypothetical protein